jgi:hypothetical protein
VGLNGAAFLGTPDVALVGGLGMAGAALGAEKIAQLKNKADGDLRNARGTAAHLLWEIHINESSLFPIQLAEKTNSEH